MVINLFYFNFNFYHGLCQLNKQGGSTSKLLIYIQKVLDSNLIWDANYTDWGIGVLLGPSHQMLG
jgi:hypothetical protein